MDNVEIKTKKQMGYWSNRFVYRDVYKWTFLKWTTINQRTVNGKYAKAPSVCANPQQISYLKHNISINMTQEEFFDYCARNENKIHGMIAAGERPSIDRICPQCDYAIENIQIIPLLDNMTKDSDPNGIKTPYDRDANRLRNRLMYTRSHVYYTPLVIDDYIRTWKMRDVKDAVKLGLIPNAYQEKTEMLCDNATTEFLNAKEAERQARINQQTDLLVERHTKRQSALIEASKKKQELTQFHADKEWIKTQPMYTEVKLATSAVLRPNVLYGVDIEGLTPTRATIKILHHLENPLL